ncbi:MAG: polysaccharide biosynthesis C-terminal domain-containing protein [Rhabdaerophilum sp.]
MLIRHTLGYLPAQLLSPLTQFATAIILTHFLGTSEYGLTMLVFASQELVFLICLSWWTTYMLRYAGTLSANGSTPDLRTSENSILLISTLAQIVVTIGIILVTEPKVSWAFYLGACVFTATRSYLNFLSERARQQQAILAYSIAQIAAPLGGLLLTLLLMRLWGSSPERVLLDFAIAQAIVGFAVAWKLGLLTRPGTIDRTLLSSAISFGLPVLISNIFGWLASNGIRFVVQYGAGAAALGLLSVGWGLATRLSAVTAMIVAAAAYPLAVKAMDAGDEAGAKGQLSLNSILLLGLIAPATLGIIAITEPFVKLLVAQEYHAATIAILPWALLGAAIRNQRMHGWDQLYLLCEAPKPMMVLEGLEALATIIGAAIGLWMAGLIGAVIGTTIVAAIVALADFVYLRRTFGLSAPLWSYARILIAAGAMYGALMALQALGYRIQADWLHILTAIAGAATIYAITILILFPEVIRALVQKYKAG